MQITRFSAARTYDAPGHFAMAGLRLQGGAAEGVTVSLSYFLPGGGADNSASPTEKYYVVLTGEVTITTVADEQILGPFDSCHIPANEARSILNRGNSVAQMLVVVVSAKERR